MVIKIVTVPRLKPLIWVGPAIILTAVFLFYPIIYTAVLSLFEWNGVNKNPLEHYVAAENYIKLTTDRHFKTALTNSLTFVFVVITVQIGIALLLAIFIFTGKFRWAAWARGIIFFPSVLSAIVVSITWRNVIFLREGLIDRLTAALGVPSFYPLGDPDLAFYAIVLVAIWQGIGFNLVIFFAGLQMIIE